MKAIGGYNEFDFGFIKHDMHKSAVALQSARSCLYLFLKSVSAKSIYLPTYLCDSLYPVINALKIKINTYDISDSLEPIGYFSFKKNDYFLLVNYFGLCDSIIEKWVSILTPEKVIVDNSQALFSKPKNNIATIYSPRKYVSMPDGGFIYSKTKLEDDFKYYDGELNCNHLIYRATGQTRKGYDFFIKAENALNDFTPLKMSKISNLMFYRKEIQKVAKARVENYRLLSAEFERHNRREIIISSEMVPLCYPLYLGRNVSEIVSHLTTLDIFLPRYWPDCDNDWYKNTLFLPVDERLNIENLNYLIKELKKLIGC